MGDGLLIIDMQKYFFRSKEKRVKYNEMIDSINELIHKFESSSNAEIIHLLSIHKADKSTWSRNMIYNNTGCLLEGSEEAEIVDDLHLSEKHHFITKTRHSAFMRTSLEQLLLIKKIERIFLCGMYTHGCIAFSAIDGWSLDFEVVIATDCVFSHRPELSEFMEERLKNMFHIEFMSNEEIIKRLVI